MFPMCSELTPRACIPDTRISQLMQPLLVLFVKFSWISFLFCWIYFLFSWIYFLFRWSDFLFSNQSRIIQDLYTLIKKRLRSRIFQVMNIKDVSQYWDRVIHKSNNIDQTWTCPVLVWKRLLLREKEGGTHGVHNIV